MRSRHPDDAEAQLRRRAVPADLGPLFADPDPPRARATDPITSHQAVPSAARRARQYEQIHAALRQIGPACADEIDAHLEALDRSWLRTSAGRRLVEMEPRGLVRRLPGQRRVTRAGKPAEVWVAIGTMQKEAA